MLSDSNSRNSIHLREILSRATRDSFTVQWTPSFKFAENHPFFLTRTPPLFSLCLMNDDCERIVDFRSEKCFLSVQRAPFNPESGWNRSTFSLILGYISAILKSDIDTGLVPGQIDQLLLFLPRGREGGGGGLCNEHSTPKYKVSAVNTNGHDREWITRDELCEQCPRKPVSMRRRTTLYANEILKRCLETTSKIQISPVPFPRS